MFGQCLISALGDQRACMFIRQNWHVHNVLSVPEMKEHLTEFKNDILVW